MFRALKCWSPHCWLFLMDVEVSLFVRLYCHGWPSSFWLLRGSIPPQIQLSLFSTYAAVFNFWYPTMVWISSQRKDDPGQRSHLSRWLERWCRRRAEADVGSPALHQLHLSLLEALNHLKMPLKGGINGGKENSLKQIRFFFIFFHMRRGRLWLAMSGVTRCDREKQTTKPLSHSVFAWAMAALLPPLIPSLFCSSTHVAGVKLVYS